MQAISEKAFDASFEKQRIFGRLWSHPSSKLTVTITLGAGNFRSDGFLRFQDYLSQRQSFGLATLGIYTANAGKSIVETPVLNASNTPTKIT